MDAIPALPDHVATPQASFGSPRPGAGGGLTSPPTSPTKKVLNNPSPPHLASNSSSLLVESKTPSNLRARASSTYVEDLLTEYVSLKCKEKLSRRDIDESTMETLKQLPLFQAIQVVHRFNDSVGPRVVNRQAFLVSIIRSTQRWWTSPPSSNNQDQHVVKGSNRLLVEDGPNTAFVVQLCMNGTLNPDVFTPSVCHALQLLTPEQIVQVAQGFGSNSLALHVANDSYYAKQQLFLSMAHAALMNFPQPNATRTEMFHHVEDVPVPQPEATANEAAELGRKRADASAAAQLPGILSEFIARTLATSNSKIKESDLDVTARDALQRVALLQAMQAMQHFSVSISDQIQKKSAYLMGILRGQEQHWERSRASKNCPGGAKDLLNLHPRLLLKIAHLCLDGNCLPSDFSPEVCFELKDLDCDTAIKAVMAFNNNKRICAGEAGGIRNRVGFFHGLLRNTKSSSQVPSVSVQTPAAVTPQSFPSATPGNASYETELNVHAKPFTPIAQPQQQEVKSVAAGTELNPTARPYSPLTLPPVAPVPNAPPPASVVAMIGDPLTTVNPAVGLMAGPPCAPTLTGNVGGPIMPAQPQQPAISATTVLPSSTSQSSGSTDNVKEMARLLESSRDAIAFLTSALARSRTSEIRLRRELQEREAQVHSLMNALVAQRESNLHQVDLLRAQLLMNVSRGFDSLSQWVATTSAAVEAAAASTTASNPSQTSPANSASAPTSQQMPPPVTGGSTSSPSLSSSQTSATSMMGGLIPSSTMPSSSNSPMALSASSSMAATGPVSGTVLSSLGASLSNLSQQSAGNGSSSSTNAPAGMFGSGGL